ncbi:YccT family protein [Photobacterium minamisatsumaniensis]|uniref:YccT family protein n=1 Tax=Photobacterium minamisatsumaniensis TaxID=2910233 RepID=UPI003D0E9521
MKLRTALIAMTACSLSFPSFADVKLELPFPAELVLINGTEADGNDTQTLKNGENQVAFRYQGTFRENGDDQIFKSDVIIMKFNEADETLKLEFPKLRSAQDTRKFNKSPNFMLINSNGENISFEQDKLIKHGLQFGRDYEAEIAAYNQSGKVAAVASAATISTLPAVTATPTQLPAATSPAKTAENASQTRNVSENMLNYWYEQADEATRQRFKAKINAE